MVDLAAAFLENGTQTAATEPSELQQELVHFFRIVEIGKLGLADGAAEHAHGLAVQAQRLGDRRDAYPLFTRAWDRGVPFTALDRTLALQHEGVRRQLDSANSTCRAMRNSSAQLVWAGKRAVTR
ncbi:hypothetical protein [Actinomadura sp. SCN-SB]|uniref:hypothetical protein n=1 Tax=Actinomadura sp. SCN-SB TaxID=3373092 RepID=UPI0037533F08